MKGKTWQYAEWKERTQRDHHHYGGKYETLVFKAVPPFRIAFVTWLQPNSALTRARLPLHAVSKRATVLIVLNCIRWEQGNECTAVNRDR